MAKINQFEAFTKIFVAYKKNWVYNIMCNSFHTKTDLDNVSSLIALVR